MNDAIPFYEDGDELTATATVAVQGKHFVAISGDKQADGTFSVAPAGAGAQAFGVAMFDAAAGKRVTIKTIESGNVMPVVASGAIAAGVAVASGAAGVAVTIGAGTVALGLCLDGAADGEDAMVLLSRFGV